MGTGGGVGIGIHNVSVCVCVLSCPECSLSTPVPSVSPGVSEGGTWATHLKYLRKCAGGRGRERMAGRKRKRELRDDRNEGVGTENEGVSKAKNE